MSDHRPIFLPPEEPPRPAPSPPDDLIDSTSDEGLRRWLIGGGVAIVVLLALLMMVLFQDGDGEVPLSAPSAAPSAPCVSPSPTSGPPAGPMATYEGLPTGVVGRITDRAAGLSYSRLGGAWRWRGGTFEGRTARQYIVTERPAVGTTWYAEISSLPLAPSIGFPAAGAPRATVDDLRTATEEQSLLLQNANYPECSRREEIAGQPVAISRRPGWLTAFKLTYDRTGLRAHDETVVVIAVDTGHDRPGVLYISIPGTHRNLRPDINTVIKSLKVV